MNHKLLHTLYLMNEGDNESEPVEIFVSESDEMSAIPPVTTEPPIVYDIRRTQSEFVEPVGVAPAPVRRVESYELLVSPKRGLRPIQPPATPDWNPRDLIFSPTAPRNIMARSPETERMMVDLKSEVHSFARENNLGTRSDAHPRPWWMKGDIVEAA